MATKSEHATQAQRYLYSVGWSEPDRAFVARVAEFPSLAAHGDSPEAALQEIRFVVEAVIEDLDQSGERMPEPTGDYEQLVVEVEFEDRCVIFIDAQMERLIQIGMKRTGRSRETIIADALRAGLESRELECWTSLRSNEEVEKRKRA
ncbi:MAG TPA: type II toxin-antitoxin system HicB family antitoxin [Blastocatellia bacterium]|nr:type II toxin-antitoxin system HicB family antitoxin [Blastocatellia bacterium]